MKLPFKVVIPARFAATRLPGKLLLEIDGKPLLQHVYEAAAASRAEQVVIATDDARIEDAATVFGAEVIMTSPEHRSGTDRIAEAVASLQEPDDAVIVNVQGDEYGLPPAIIDQLADALQNHADKPMATLCEKITTREQLNNPNVVKVVMDEARTALYFSRSVIPWCTGADTLSLEEYPLPPFRHIGIYAYRVGFLKTYAALPHCPLEDSEKLEQLRVLYHGYKILVAEACVATGMEINTPDDLERARRGPALGFQS